MDLSQFKTNKDVRKYFRKDGKAKLSTLLCKAAEDMVDSEQKICTTQEPCAAKEDDSNKCLYQFNCDHQHKIP